MPEFTHIENDRASMVDISEKKDVSRQATAGGRIYLRPETLDAIKNGDVIKGNVLATARVAGIMAAKHTSNLIPMCHPIPVSSVSVDFEFGEDESYIEAKCTAKTFGRTGIEMEALTGVSVALLTVWDMVKSAEKDEDGQYPETGIEDVHVIEKIKG
ncbi:cyclic pyranopterin monophosphate synthase MoaC [Methanoplanus limicola]|uniref:Probable cyclic pyranopterin monophosphate synthase n=1 Tax=Methanoplanus limicola DSM 2279 TaxID=937775 RepID=H1Z2B8_9EURY|nr:cyclic pyranopterin monophosphate synthase MoaC [Methanoplanus limicola]EHQ34647.1 GTP cyclohydrolase subunit MoaC [Methanoplanus limicola DSM 2279]